MARGRTRIGAAKMKGEPIQLKLCRPFCPEARIDGIHKRRSAAWQAASAAALRQLPVRPTCEVIGGQAQHRQQEDCNKHDDDQARLPPLAEPRSALLQRLIFYWTTISLPRKSS